MQISLNRKIATYLEEGKRAGRSVLALQGARRAGKTYTTCQWLLLQMYNCGDVVIFASMTAEQGRKGAYEDCRNILKSWGALGDVFEIYKTPREIHCKRNNTESGREGVAYFSSYQDPETAKGGACDWVFINEANKFTRQQYYDLAANARKGVILDYNPNAHFWVEELPNVEPLLCSWKDNIKHLTQAQKDWFAQIYEAAHRDGATAADWYYYRVYYEGQYSEISGSIFTRANIHTIDYDKVPWAELKGFAIFCDPSALRGADFFPVVLSAHDSAGNVWVLQTNSRNDGEKSERVEVIKQMACAFDGVRIFAETNGLVGIDFFEFAQASGLPVEGWCSRGNKFDRIIAKYQDITKRTFFVDDARLGGFLEQVYTFAEKCEHDDNIDAVATSLMIQGQLMR